MTDGTARLRALSEVPEGEVSAALATTGLWFDVGVATLRVRSDAPALAAQLRSVYANFPFRSDADWADLHVDLLRPRGPRRWLRPQVKLRSDGLQPFAPFAADSPLPLLEWGANWLIGRRTNDAAVLKPVALKNASIDVIRRFEPSAPIGPSFPKTRKGVVAHLAASTDAVARVKQACLAGAVILPRWQADQPTSWEPLDEQEAFSALAFNAFNYPITGAAGFRAVVGLVRRCPAWQLVYSDLDHALATIEAAWSRVVEQHRMAQP